MKTNSKEPSASISQQHMERKMDENNLWGTLHVNTADLSLRTIVFSESLGERSYKYGT